MREILEARIDGRLLLGTLHRPPAEVARSRIGVLFFNAGHVPRDGHGGFWARLGDVLAAEGYPVFRFDFPGFGDSDGELPVRIETFWRHVKQGGMAPLAVALGEWVRSHHGLDGVVMGGLCGAGIHSIFAVERKPEGIAGLLMLEPEFFHLEQEAPDAAQGPRGGLRVLTRVASGWTWLRVLTGANPLLKPMPGLRHRLLELYTHVSGLPERTNVDLVRAWRRVLDLKVPAIVLTSRDEMWDLYFRKVNVSVVGPRLPDQIEHHSVVGTNHAFTRDDHMGRAFALIVPWMRARFPVVRAARAEPPPAGPPVRPAAQV